MTIKKATRGLYLRGKTYWLNQQVNKKRSFVTLETSDLSEAISKAAEVRESGVLPDGVFLDHVVERYIVYCRDSGVWSASSVDSKAPVMRKWAKWCGNVTPDSVTSEKILAYHAHRVTVTSDSTAYGNLMVLQGFFRWCLYREKCCRMNPVLALTEKTSPIRIKPPKMAARRDFCTAGLRDRLIDKCPREDLKFCLFAGFHAGLRFQEIVEARAFWFDMEASQIHLRKHAGIQFKDREERSIPMTAQFKAFLEGYGMKKRAAQSYMLHPDVVRGKSLYRWDFGRPFGDYMSEQGVPWVTPHVMRHTFASLLASAGVSIYHVAVWMGDGVKVVQKHYAKLIPMHCEIQRAFPQPPSATPAPQRKRASSKPAGRRSRKG